MFSKSVQDAINEQINNEFSASYIYLAMSAYCEQENFTGCSKWLRLQSQEEYGHGTRLLDFLLARDGAVKLKAIAEPNVQYKSIAAVFEQALKQEQETTAEIDQLYDLSHKEKAFAALVELQWFITEQVEEEKTAREIVAKFHLCKDDPRGTDGPRPRAGQPDRRGRRRREVSVRHRSAQATSADSRWRFGTGRASGTGHCDGREPSPCRMRPRLDQLADLGDQVDGAAAIAPFVVVPAQGLQQVAVHDLGPVGHEDRAVRVADDVGRDDRVFGCRPGCP